MTKTSAVAPRGALLDSTAFHHNTRGVRTFAGLASGSKSIRANKPAYVAFSLCHLVHHISPEPAGLLRLFSRDVSARRAAGKEQ